MINLFLMLWVHVSDQSYFFMSDHEEKWPDVYSVGHLSDIMSTGMSCLISIFSVCSFVKCSWLMMRGKMLFEERLLYKTWNGPKQGFHWEF